VAIHTGLLDMLQDDEDAIAFVLGHEIGHCMLRHTFETAATKDVFLVPIMEALEIVSGVDFFSSVDGLTGTFVQSIVVDWLDLFPSTAYSHMHEYEADRLGAYFAAAACFNAKNGAEQLFGALEKYEKESSLNISFAVREILKHEYLKTHPNSEKRVSNVLTLVAGTDFGRTRGICKHAKRCQLARQDLQASKASSFKLNERVECRDYGEEWRVGRVVSVEPLMVQPDGFLWTAGYTWDEVRGVGLEMRRVVRDGPLPLPRAINTQRGDPCSWHHAAAGGSSHRCDACTTQAAARLELSVSREVQGAAGRAGTEED
jgi:hypothetical protein